MSEEELKRMEDFVNATLKSDKPNEYRLGYEDALRRCYYLVDDLQQKIDKAIENCKKSIECINQKLQDDKTIKVVDGKVANMNDYQIVRLKAIRMKCKELLEILGEKE